jgi:hypothetical protein
MVASLIVAALVQAAAAAEPAELCSLVTPGGHFVAFKIETAVEQARLVPAEGSIWPASTAVASASSAQNRFDVDGFRLTLEGETDDGQRQVATLSRASERHHYYPVAYGYCQRDAADGHSWPSGQVNQAAIDDYAGAFDPQRWPEDRCGMILSDGRRIAMLFQLRGPDQVAMVSTGLWNRQPVAARLRAGTSFSGPNGLSGSRELVILEREEMGADLIRFRNLGDPSADGLTGYAICGYTRIVRRPVRS